MVAATEFYNHAHQLSGAVMTAIEVYCTGAGLPWDPAAFVKDSPHDIEQLGKDILFYGSDIFPTPDPEVGL